MWARCTQNCPPARNDVMVRNSKFWCAKVHEWCAIVHHLYANFWILRTIFFLCTQILGFCGQFFFVNANFRILRTILFLCTQIFRFCGQFVFSGRNFAYRNFCTQFHFCVRKNDRMVTNWNNLRAIQHEWWTIFGTKIWIVYTILHCVHNLWCRQICPCAGQICPCAAQICAAHGQICVQNFVRNLCVHDLFMKFRKILYAIHFCMQFFCYLCTQIFLFCVQFLLYANSLDFEDKFCVRKF